MRRGWCPTIHEPMPSGDGLLVRVKPPLGRLGAAELRLVAHAARRCGNGVVELTGRGNLQVRGLTQCSAEDFAGAIVQAGLASADPAVESRRNVTVSPLAGADPATATDTLALAAAIEAMLADPRWSVLPPKFGIAVDGGGVLPLSVRADVTVRTDGMRRWFTDEAVQTSNNAGFISYAGSNDGGFAIGIPFGETGAATLLAIAELAERFSDSTVRLSPWRALCFGRVRSAEVEALQDECAALGLIADPADPRLRIAACIGSAGCASGTVPARADAARLAARHARGFLHLSGCAKGCAHPAAADVTLVGVAGRYDLVRSGRAGDVPARTGLQFADLAL